MANHSSTFTLTGDLSTRCGSLRVTYFIYCRHLERPRPKSGSRKTPCPISWPIFVIVSHMYGKMYYTYIMSNLHRTVLYIGVTNSIGRRSFEHREHRNKKSFSARYNLTVLLYYEEFDMPEDAIRREKQLKGWTRQKKLDLIKTKNLNLRNLFDEIPK